jgi:hypothetical protein
VTDHSPHLLQLGKLVANGAALELALVELATREINPDDRHRGRVVAAGESTDWLINKISALTGDPAVRDWCRLARRAMDARNRFVHGARGVPEDGSAPTLIRARRKEGILSEPWDDAALAEAVAFVLEAIATAPPPDIW